MSPSDIRLYAAAAIVVAYALFTLYCLRPLWARKTRKPHAKDATLIAFASQTGFAHQLALQTAQSLQSAGHAVELADLADLDIDVLSKAERALFVVSTTGEGDAPDSAAKFVRNVLSKDARLATLRYGLLALGDRQYDNFCAFGHQLDRWLRQRGAQTLFDMIEVDDGDDGALRHWQHNLALAFEAPDLPDWEAPSYQRWQLTAREHVNPGSAGDPCFHIELRPLEGSKLEWQAGDIVEIDPNNSSTTDQRLPHREYSIASLPSDGALHLLVRQMKRPNGELGLGSGWLTQQAAIGTEVLLRVRANPNFHPPAADAPLLLIGNGTGIAGLRALLKARIAHNRKRNWLIFGERNAAHDRFYRADLDTWQAQGCLTKLDLVFSRDQAERRYVQHRVAECAADLRQWIAEGAYIYVCGSLDGMAPGVHAALVEALGAETVEMLAEEGRYRRDVY
jgi:sulfite reductase (NADPH) flavoprotein alpha-component